MKKLFNKILGVIKRESKELLIKYYIINNPGVFDQSSGRLCIFDLKIGPESETLTFKDGDLIEARLKGENEYKEYVVSSALLAKAQRNPWYIIPVNGFKRFRVMDFNSIRVKKSNELTV